MQGEEWEIQIFASLSKNLLVHIVDFYHIFKSYCAWGFLSFHLYHLRKLFQKQNIFLIPYNSRANATKRLAVQGANGMAWMPF